MAMADESDSYHQVAKEQWALLVQARARLLTSNYIVDETITLAERTLGHPKAVEAGDLLFTSKTLTRVLIGEELQAVAWDIFRKYDDQHYSFTDCTSFATMRRDKIRVAFTFDGDFSIAGFEVIPS